MELLRDFTKLDKSDVGLAGGKGASLGEMTQAGIPVPPGFVVLSASFEKFIEETELVAEIDAILDSVNHEEIHTVENASEKIKALILAAEMPKDIATGIKFSFKKLGAKYVAVRSSATAEDSSSAAWAGQLESYLNTTEKDLLRRVKQCWASLYTPRAIFYRFEKGLHKQKISVAVVVQKMVESEVSGIAFSVHPVTQDRNQIIIEASYGLGEAIVSGQVTPDSYVIEKEPRRIIERTVQTKARGMYRSLESENKWKNIPKVEAEKQALSDDQILKLSELILRIENHYGFPCDVEWAFEKGEFYIVQSRPITTLSKQEEVDKITFEKIYTRDTTYIMQELWAFGCSEGIKKEFGWKNPYLPGIIHYMNQGSIEIWENLKATEWLEDIVLKENKSDPKFIDKILKTYQVKLETIHGLWKEKNLGINKLIALIEASREAMPYFIAYYYSAVNDKTPKAIRAKALAMRNKDEFFAQNDIIIRNSISALYSQMKNYETTLFIDELGKIPAIELLKDRKQHSLIIQGKEQFVGTLSDFENANPQFSFKKEVVAMNDPSLITGEIAQKGNVIGRVKILRRRDQVDEVKEGDVIVSPMTTPDFLPAMKKALAFVTDEGGITCHAGIVARELKKPCIIGTKIATEVLKDGDMIEVDANSGTIRILQVVEKSKYEKLFSRDFCLASVEAWVRGESTNAKGWTDLSQPFLPYIVTQRSNDTVHFYYDLRGVEWVQDLLVKLAKEDKTFLKKIETEVLARIAYLQPIYEKEQTLGTAELKKFIRELEAGYPWFEAMWWFCQMDQAKLKGLEIKAVQTVRVRTDKLCNGSDTVIRKSLVEIYPHLGDLVGVLSTNEIISGTIPSSSELEDRERGYFFGNDILLTGSTISEVENKFQVQFAVEKVDKNVKELSGEIAQRGIARGVVRKVMGHKQIGKIQEGEILVSPMTMPDFLPAMKKAAAFVTDEGGITCHAAIVAREMKKPCITGTKIATEILHDGDFVEVDAEKGIVRRLKIL